MTKKSKKGYPERLRRVSYVDKELDKRLVFLTNDFDIPAQTVADVYKQRWQVELFFKWIKQHLRFKGFNGRIRERGEKSDMVSGSVFTCSLLLPKNDSIFRARLHFSTDY